MRIASPFACFALLSLSLAACTGNAPSTSLTSGGGGTATTVTASGTAESPAPSPHSEIVAVWTVSSGSPDYVYVFGRGTISGNRITMNITSAPPAEALNAGNLGVGVVVALERGQSVPDGRLSNDQAKALKAAAISPDHAIIYRADASAPVVKNGWDTSFPQGYACGACEDADATFDTFKPSDCSAIRIVPASSKPKLCNWT